MVDARFAHPLPRATDPWNDPERLPTLVDSGEDGPTLVVLGAMHGNEPAGLLALQSLRTRLRRGRGLERGRLVGVAGNLAALRRGRRFIDRDLNRDWSGRRIARATRSGPDSAEDAEMVALAAIFDRVAVESRGPLYFVDLHTTSGESPPFASSPEDDESLELCARLRVPNVLGIEDHLKGTAFEYLQERGFQGFIFEGGQHADPSSVESSEAAVWLLLEALEMLEPVPQSAGEPEDDAGWAEEVMERVAADLPSRLRIEYRHALEPRHQFRMVPGLRSFQEVEAGQLLAHDRLGEVRSPNDGRLLMPLYQPQGDEGFFTMSELV